MKKRLVLAMTAAIMAVGIASCGKTPSTVTDPNEIGTDISTETEGAAQTNESGDESAKDTQETQVAEAGSESSVEPLLRTGGLG